MPYKCLDKERRIYVKKGSGEALRNLARLVFDFDGVLVDLSQSYPEAVSNVVDYYFLEILGLEGEKGKLTTLGDVQMFKDTGLYNNDWNLCNAIITYYLVLLTRKLQRKRTLQDFMRRFSNIQFSEVQSFVQVLGEVGGFLSCHGVDASGLINTKNDEALGLKSFLAQASTENRGPLEAARQLVLPQVGSDELALVEKLVPYDTEKPDLLRRLFEESCLGKELFNQFYGVSSAFNFEESFLEKQVFIPCVEVLSALRRRFGKFAIYSEKSRVQGMYLLERNNLEEYFDKRPSVFLEDIIESQAWREGADLGKPNPTLFIDLIEKLVGNLSAVAYVGDSAADALLVENARMKDLSNVLFLGVLCSCRYPNRLFSYYAKHGADAIMTDVNDIPHLLAGLGGEI